MAANLSAGHLLFAILAGFGVIFKSAIVIIIFITLLEIAVAIIQAYVFLFLENYLFGGHTCFTLMSLFWSILLVGTIGVMGV